MCGNDMSRVMLDFSSPECLNQGVTSTLEEVVKRSHRISIFRDIRNVTGYDPEQPYPTLKLSLTWKFVLVLSQRCPPSEEMSVIWNFIKVLSCSLSSYVKGLVSWHRNYDLQKKQWLRRKIQIPSFMIPLPRWLFFLFLPSLLFHLNSSDSLVLSFAFNTA